MNKTKITFKSGTVLKKIKDEFKTKNKNVK